MTTFRVYGEPVPQGSLKVIHGRVMHINGKKLREWRGKIQAAALQNGQSILDGPVTVNCVFYVRRPKTVTRNEPSVRPDLDKLIRAVLDALTGVAFVDDSQVVEIHASKHYGEPGMVLGVWQ